MKDKIAQLGDAIKRLRQKQGISQEILARRADLKLSNLAKLEGGFNLNPTLSSLISLAKVLSGNNIDVLLSAHAASHKKVELLNLKEFGGRLKKLRQKQGISQEILARRADLKLSNLAKLEGGFNLNPTLATLKSIAKVVSNGKINELLIK